MNIIINEATYSLPCRSFVIDYSISQKRTLAIVKEFTIRLLYSTGQISPAKIANYFGFSIEEMQTVLVSLQEERLIDWDEGEARLSNYANDHFEQVNGKATPRFFEVTDQIDTVSFDLLTFRLLTEKPSSLTTPNNLEIPLPPEALGHLTEKAKNAFDKHFSLFLEKIKGIDIYKNSTELYKINQVFNRNDSLVPIKIQYVMEPDTPQQPTIKYADKWMDDWDNDKSLFAAISSKTEQVPSRKNCTSEQFSEYIRITGDPISLMFYDGENFDFSKAIEKYIENKSIFELNTRMLIGNLYTADNMKSIHYLLDQVEEKTKKISIKDAIWCISPEEKIWGRGPELEKFIRSLERKTNDSVGDDHTNNTIIVTPTNSPKDAYSFRDCYKFIGADFLGVNGVLGNHNCEILLIPNTLAACSFHFPCENLFPLTLPFGFITTAPERVEKIQSNLLKHLNTPTTPNNHFEKKDAHAKDGVFYKKILPFITNQA